MIKTKNLDLICEEYENYAFDWGRIISRYNKIKEKICNKTPTIIEYCRHFSEAHLDLFLEDMVKTHPELKIKLNPVEETYAGDFDFRYVKGRLTSHKFTSVLSDGWEQEYDLVATIDSVPVVFEIKLARWKNPKTRSNETGKKIMSTKGVKNQLRSEIYVRKLYPLTLHFNSDVGYVMIIPEQQYHEKQSSPIYKDFLERNGYIVPFKTINPSFNEAVLEKLKENNLEIRVS